VTEHRKTERDAGLDTLVDDATMADDGLSTVVVDDEDDPPTGSSAMPRDAFATVVVPENVDASPLSSQGASRPRRTQLRPFVLAMGIVGLGVFGLAIVLVGLVRAVLEGGEVRAPSAPVQPVELSPPPVGSPEAEPLRATARCSYQPGSGPSALGTLSIACEVINPRATAARVNVVPVIYHGDVAERVYREELQIGPGERIVRRYDVRKRAERDIGTSCACEATQAP
jgi:hypothetical protein